MTKTVEQAIRAFQTLPADVQEKAAQQLLSDIAQFSVLKSEIAKGRADRNYPPLFFEAVVRGSDRAQAMMPTMTAKGFAPLSLAVSTVVRTSASASAAHMAR